MRLTQRRRAAGKNGSRPRRFLSAADKISAPHTGRVPLRPSLRHGGAPLCGLPRVAMRSPRTLCRSPFGDLGAPHFPTPQELALWPAGGGPLTARLCPLATGDGDGPKAPKPQDTGDIRGSDTSNGNSPIRRSRASHQKIHTILIFFRCGIHWPVRSLRQGPCAASNWSRQKKLDKIPARFIVGNVTEITTCRAYTVPGTPPIVPMAEAGQLDISSDLLYITSRASADL
jgi:hypothetical protein